ncbi:MAG: hypothetical protein MUF87_14355 [Anaerolineae bacterium]|jgi:tetratricopeptide (TPR) repeat protein|nr:hypothetical protein [Anaerolineae bacterium]
MSDHPVFRLFSPLFAGKSATTSAPVAPDWEAPVRRGEYETAMQIAKEITPAVVQRIALIRIYLRAARFDEAQRGIDAILAKTGLEDHWIGQAHALKMEWLTFQRRYEDAVESAAQALEYTEKDLGVHIAVARLKLFQNQPELAQRQLDAAEKLALQTFGSLSGEQLALRAWEWAQMAKSERADQTMLKAFERVDSADKSNLAGLYWIGGHIARAQGRDRGGRLSLEKASQLDPRGIYGWRATQDLQTR